MQSRSVVVVSMLVEVLAVPMAHLGGTSVAGHDRCTSVAVLIDLTGWLRGEIRAGGRIGRHIGPCGMIITRYAGCNC